jgi:ribonucleoside-diphosphate reductase alpha chain
MALGEPYDSQIGRAFAGAVTSLMTGQAYLTSGKIAETMTALIPAGEKLIDDYELHTGHCVAAGGGKLKRSGAFPGYFINKDSFLGVMKLHRKHAQQFVSDSGSPNAALFNSAAEVWDKVLGQGKASGYRNAQVTVLAPTGTIGFMMDCDTTGIEPELALVKYKRLVGGSVMKIVNETVGAALRELGYNPAHVDELIEYIDKNGSLEGSTLQAKHLPVFDTSFKPEKGTRCIHYLGHIKMMAAVQPFLSGAISKTVNMPSDATVEDIAEAYLQAWKMGVKAVAIYRDGSKTNQVLTTKKDKGKTEPGTAGDILAGLPAVAAVLDDLNAPPHAVRHRLPDTRPAVTHKFSIAGHEGYLTVGLYKNGQPGEIFVAMAKEGSTLSGLMDSFALVFSLSLQHGVPLTTLCSKLAHTGFDPSGWTGNADLGYAKSIMDYLARWLELQFLKSKQGVLFETKPATAPVSAAPTTSTGLASSDSPACPDCGALTVRNGSCFKCMECGSTTGCS